MRRSWSGCRGCGRGSRRRASSSPYGRIPNSGCSGLSSVTIYFSPSLSRIRSVSLVLSSPPLNPPCHLVTLSPCHLVTLSPCHHVTSSPCHLVTSSPHHLDISSTHHSIHLDLDLDLASSSSLSSPHPHPHLILVLVLASSSSSPRLFSYLCTPLSIPFLGPYILPTLIPVPLISFVIPVYHLYSSFHLCPSSRPLVSPFILFPTCSLILDHVLPVFYSHHGHPSPGSRISLIFISSLVLTQLGPCSLSL